jgi:DNA polymerase-3 subunit gamma/tau
MSLYRTYRPKSFADVVGQDHIVTTLENAASQQKLAHAFLFAGSRGTGKTSVARILAKTMLTQGITDPKIKEQVEASVDDGSLVDLVEIDGASNRGIDDIRGLVEKIQFSPVAASAKVYIIDEVHMLTKEAFNALLKTLEEPPSYAYFILATTELQKIPATIQSRCQRFLFRQVPEEDIIRRLQFIADRERITIDRAALRAVAHHADGGLRDAISLLDQLRSLPKIGLEDVQERIGESGHEYVEHMFDALGTGDKATLLELVRKMESTGISLETVTRLLLGEARARLHKAVDEGSSIAELSRCLPVFLGALRDMRVASVPGLVLEAALIRLAMNDAEEPAPRSFGKKKPVETVKEQPRVEAPIAKPAPAPVKTAPVMTKAPETPAIVEKKSDAIVEAPDVTLAALRNAWPGVLKEITTPAVRMSLKNARVHVFKDPTLTLAFASAFHRDRSAKPDAARGLEDILEKTFKRPIKVEFTLLEEEKGAGGAADESMVNLAEAASEVF